MSVSDETHPAKVYLGKIALSAVTLLLALSLIECASRVLLYLETPAGLVFDDAIIYTGAPHGDLMGRKLNDIGCVGADLRPPKLPGERRILMLGGSTSFASEYVDEVTEVVRARNPSLSVSVVSCGKPRYTSYVNLVNLGRNLLRYSPDVIVVYLGINDSIYDAFPWLENLPDIGFFDWRAPTESIFLRLLRYHVIDKGLRSTPDFPSGPLRSAEILRRNLESIVALAEANGARVVLSRFAISLPTEDVALRRRIEADEPRMRYFWGNVDSTVRAVRSHNEVIEAVARAHGLALAEPDRAVPADSVHFTDICHMKPPGFEVLGRTIGEAIGRLE